MTDSKAFTDAVLKLGRNLANAMPIAPPAHDDRTEMDLSASYPQAIAENSDGVKISENPRLEEFYNIDFNHDYGKEAARIMYGMMVDVWGKCTAPKKEGNKILQVVKSLTNERHGQVTFFAPTTYRERLMAPLNATINKAAEAVKAMEREKINNLQSIVKFCADRFKDYRNAGVAQVRPRLRVMEDGSLQPELSIDIPPQQSSLLEGIDKEMGIGGRLKQFGIDSIPADHYMIINPGPKQIDEIKRRLDKKWVERQGHKGIK